MQKEDIENLKNKIVEEIDNIKSGDLLEELKVKALGKKGEITALLKNMGSLGAEERASFGAMVNNLKNNIEGLIEEKKNKLLEQEIDRKLKEDVIDITLPSNIKELGHKHPLTIVADEIKETFLGMGYSIAEGPEVELTFFNFDCLNTPADHPARDIQDTMYVTNDIILRSQTSPVQVRAMLEGKPPIKIICPGRVYRSDSVDATHSPMFNQVEGLVVDKNITMGDLKGTLESFAKNYFGSDTLIRLRPHHFPFTEPSAEVDVSCFVCGGKGCKVCKGEGWIEILGCGMVHPSVLKAGGIDPNIYSGFAFGMGIERAAMIKYGINDMRYLFENDVRFLKQF